MSQASNHVKWCIEKAKKELEEAKRLGKAPKHRGLVQVKPDIDNSKRYLEKAEHNLKTALYMVDGGFSDWAVSAAFYCMYHCMLATLAKFGYESRNQTCTIAAIEYLKEEGKIDFDDKFIKMLKPDSEEGQFRVIEMREEYTYGFEIAAEGADIKKLMQLCKELIDKTKSIIYD